MIRSFCSSLRQFRKDRSGAAMVEFAIALPLCLLMLAIVIEGARMTWVHQAAASGVRDASRYFARIQNPSVCDSSASVDAFDNSVDIGNRARDIVLLRVGDTSASILPRGLRNVSVNHAMQCTSVNYGTAGSAVVPVVEVAVTLTIDFPFGGVFGLFGQPLDPLTTTISDESRVYGI